MANFLPRVLGAAFVSCLAASPLQAQVWIPPQEPCEFDPGRRTKDAGERLGEATEADDPAIRATKLEEAADKLREAFDRDENAGAWYYLGRYYVITEDPVGADSAFHQAAELIPDCAEDIQGYLVEAGAVALGAGSAAWVTGDRAAAVEHLQLAARLHPENPVPSLYMGRVFVEQSEADSAAKYVRIGVDLAGDDPQHARNRTSALRDLARLFETTAMETAGDRAVQSSVLRDSVDRRIGRDATILARLIAQWSGVNLRPEQLVAYQNDSAGRTEALAALQQTRESIARQHSSDSTAAAPALAAAVSAYEEYSAAAPDDIDGGFRLVRLYGAAGQLDGVRRTTERLLTSETLSDGEVLRAAQTTFRESRYAMTAAVLEPLLQRNPNARSGLFLLSRVHLVRVNGEQLLATAQKLTQIDPMNAQSVRMLAGGWELVGRVDSARKYVALSDSGLQWTVDVSQFQALTDTRLRGQIRNLVNRPLPTVTLEFEFLDAQGATLYTGSADIPARQPGGQEQFQIQLPQTGAVAWRYRRR